MFITIGGTLGSGKSTACGVLKAKYGFEVFSTGSILRDLAKGNGMSALEFNDFITSNENEVDEYIDKRVVEIASQNESRDIVFDSRLAWHFVPHAYKVFLMVSRKTAAERVFKGRSDEVERYSSAEEALKHLNKRKELEDIRFKRLYGLDVNDLGNYDLTLNTESLTADEVAGIIVKNANKIN